MPDGELMKPDRAVGPDRTTADSPGPIERAHLRRPDDRSHTMARAEAPAEFADLIAWFWIPTWSVPPGHEAPQQVLQYPCALAVVTPDYARFYGATSGLSTTTLTGDGWAVGVRFRPAAGRLVAGLPMTEFTDRHVELAEVLGPAGPAVTESIRSVMTQAATSGRDPVDAHRAATEHWCAVLTRFLPVDDEGRLINEVVDYVEDHPEVRQVAQVCDHFDMTERRLQRLTQRRIGLSPKWLIQRRRLQEGSVRLRQPGAAGSLAELATELGYADQAHFTRDFRAVTAMTPGEFAARYRGTR